MTGPPEPECSTVASVWMAWPPAAGSAVSMPCWTPLTMPTVAVRSRLRELPIATIGSPTWTRSESPSGSGLSDREWASTWRTATSVVGSCPTIDASTSSLPEKLTLRARAPETTRFEVTM